MKRLFKILLTLSFVLGFYPAQPLFASSDVGQINDTDEIERVTVSADGKLFAFDKEGEVLAGWPKDFTQNDRLFIFGPRLVDTDFDLQKEIIAVSEDSNTGDLRMHVFKGNGAELSNWQLDLPDNDLLRTPLIADINQDSSLDIIYATKGQKVVVYRRDLQPNSQFSASVNVNPYPAFGDMDNNGLNELYAAVGNKIVKWSQVGQRTDFFILAPDEEIIGAPTIRDMNNDQKPELVFSTTNHRLLAVDSTASLITTIQAPDGVQFISPAIVEDVDVDRLPEILVMTSTNDIMAYDPNGVLLEGWPVSGIYRMSVPVGGVVADDAYEGLLSTRSGWDQFVIYRNKFGRYSRIELGENVQEWDTESDFDFIEVIRISDVIAFPKLFTPNGDGVNDTTQISYRISDEALVAFDLYDNHERFISRIKNKERKSAGSQQYVFTGMDNKGTLTTNDDVPLDTGLYIIKIVAESNEGFVTTAVVSVVVNGIKAEIESPEDTNREDNIYPTVFGEVILRGIATDPNFGEGNLDADFQSFKLYYRPGVWSITESDILTAGQFGSGWIPLVVPTRHQCPDNDYNEPNDVPFPNSNVSCRPVQHGELGTFDTTNPQTTPNGEYTILLKVLDSNGNTAGRVNYDALVVSVRNPNANDPYDQADPTDPLNPNNPLYQGPQITNPSLSNTLLSRENPSTTVSYTLGNETSHVHVDIFPLNNNVLGSAVAVYSFNYQAPGNYNFNWNGTNTLGLNVNGGRYRIRISAAAVDGTGFDSNEDLELDVMIGFAASDILEITSLMATPDNFNPFGFSANFQPETSTISYTLTKEARVSILIYDGDPESGGVLQKTLVNQQIRETDFLVWDGTGDNGLILPVGRDYVVRLLVEGIDIGNNEVVHEDITVHLNASSINTSIAADISQLKGASGEVSDNDGVLRSMAGNADFLWRTTGEGFVRSQFNWEIGARGEESFNDYQMAQTSGPIDTLYVACMDWELIANPWYPNDDQALLDAAAAYFFDRIKQPVSGSLPNGSTIDTITATRTGGNFAGPTHIETDDFGGNHTEYSVNLGQSLLLTDPFPAPLVNPNTFTLFAYVPAKGILPWNDGCNNSTSLCDYFMGDGCYNWGGSRKHCWAATCPGANITVDVSGGSSGQRSWPLPGNPNPAVSGGYTVTSTSNNPANNIASYNGPVGSGQADVTNAWITNYTLTLSNRVNGQSFNGSSNGSAINLPGLTGWLSGSSLSAQATDNNGGLITTFRSHQHDPFTSGAPYRRIWGWYRNFNQTEYNQYTNSIRFYNDGYAPNIFNGNPGSTLYTFSDVVHINSWNIEVRYPNITVSKPDGDNLLNTGQGNLDIFEINQLSIAPASTIGNQNANIQDFFKLKLLPEAVPKRFVEIWGSAGANYELFYYDASEENPRWYSIEPRTTNAVNNGILAHWDVTRLNGENYTVLLRTTDGNGDVNQDTIDIGIGQRVNPGAQTRVYSAFKRSSLIFDANSISQPELITITPVNPTEADFTLPNGVAPIGPIFEIKPDDIEIDPNYHVQLELVFTPSELEDAFGVQDASELQIYNLAGDEILEGLVTIVQFDDRGDSDPSNDVYRFTANLEHFSQYMLSRKVAGHLYIDTPASDASIRGTVNVRGRVETDPRPADQQNVPGPLSSLNTIEIGYYPAEDPNNKTLLDSQISVQPTTSIALFDLPWDVSSLNGNYVLYVRAEGPQGGTMIVERPVAIDNLPALSTLLINGQAIADGTQVEIALGSIIEIRARDSASDDWQSGVAAIEFSFDGEPFADYTQPFLVPFSEGAHTIVYHAIDNNGNMETDKDATIVVQEALPDDPSQNTDVTLLLSGPNYKTNGQTWVNNDTLFTLQAQDSDFDVIKFRADGSEYLIYQEPFGIDALLEGPYLIEYFVVDDFGLRGDIHTAGVILDYSPPISQLQVMSGDYQDNGPDWLVTPQTQIEIRAVDEGENPVGLSHIECKFDSNPWITCPNPIQVNQTTTLLYRGVDLLGNTEENQQIVLRLDGLQPSIQITFITPVISPNGDGVLDTASIQIDINDNFSSQLYFTMTLTDGNQQYTLWDDEPLGVGTNALEWDGRVNNNLIPEGVYQYTASVRDAQDNVSDTQNGTLTVDVTPPTVNITGATIHQISPNGDTYADVLEVEFELADNLATQNILTELRIESGVDFIVRRVSQLLNIPPSINTLSWNGSNEADNLVFDGPYTFSVVATDPAGNVSQPNAGNNATQGNVFVDSQPPVTELVVTDPSYDDGTTFWLGVDANIQLIAEDPAPAAGLADIFYSLGGQGFQTYQNAITLPQEAVDYQFQYYAQDIVGNPEAVQEVVVRLDTTPPVSNYQIGEPKLGEESTVFVSPRTPITFTAEDPTGVGVESTLLQLQDTNRQFPYETPFTLEGLEDGVHQINYQARDYVDNEENLKTLEVMLDQTPPETHLIIDGPSHEENDFLYITSLTTLSFEAVTNRDDLERTEYQIDDEDWELAQPISFSKEGEYILRFRSTDTLENTEPVHIRRLVVDNSPPETFLGLNQGDGERFVTGDTQITLGGNDSASGTGTIEYSIDGGEYVNYEGPFSLDDLPPGTHTIRYRVIDPVGNASEEQVIEVELIAVQVERMDYAIPRALVYLLQTFDLRKEDPRPNEDFIREMLTEMGAYYEIVEQLDEFLNLMRSDKFNTFVFATDAYYVDFSEEVYATRMMKELKTRIHKGDSFISLADYSEIHGSSWHDLTKDFVAEDQNAVAPLMATDLAGSVHSYHYGNGTIVRLFKDIGRLSLEGDPSSFRTALAETIERVRPIGEPINSGEVIDFRLVFTNIADHSVTVQVKETLPSGGWIETAATSGEMRVDQRDYTLEIDPQGERIVEYLYRMPVETGEHQFIVDISATWNIEISDSDSLESAYNVENDLSLLIDTASGPYSLVKTLGISSVEEPMDQLSARLYLDPSEIYETEKFNALIDLALEAISAVPDIAEREAILSDLDEVLENLELRPRLSQLDFNLSAGEGDPDTPTPFHGDPSSYVKSGGGCALVKAQGKTSAHHARFFLLFISVFVFYMFNKRLKILR